MQGIAYMMLDFASSPCATHVGCASVVVGVDRGGRERACARKRE
jgi:hypothetical protein